MKAPTILVGLLCVGLVSCTTVRPEDQSAWIGVPVAALETHPVFITMHLVRVRASDGTEIWNYVNGRDVSSCGAGGTAFVGYTNMASYNAFTSCMNRFQACNNIFYVENGIVTAYTPVGSGGARCYTDETSQPYFRGATNYR